MRYASRRLRQRLTWLVEFMRMWFSVDELAHLAHSRADLHRGQACDTVDLEYSRALAAALPEGHDDRYRLEWSVFSSAAHLASDARREIEDLFDFKGDDRQFESAKEYLERFEALDAQLARCPHVAPEAMDEWIAGVKGLLSLSLAGKDNIARGASSLTTPQYRHLIKSIADERSSLAARIPDATTRVVYQAVREGRFFPDCPNSQLAHTQLIAEFSSEPAAFRLGLDLLSSRHGDAWVERAYRKAIELDPKSADAWNGLGILLVEQLGRCEDSEAAFRRAIELDPKSAAAWNNLGNLRKDHLGRSDEAEAAYRKAIELDPKSARAWNNLGKLLNDHPSRTKEAEAAYRKAIELDPKSAAAWNNLGNLLQDHLARDDDAATAYRNAMEIDLENPWPPANLARLEALRKHAEAAATHYRQVIALLSTRAQRNGVDGANVALQAHLWLGNRDAASLALSTLAESAAREDKSAFFLLREQARECHQIGIGPALANLMSESTYAEFLRPFSLALRAAGQEGEDALATAPPEMADIAREVLADLRRAAAPVGDRRPTSSGG
jgi:Flp pilus assembly protein TadD